MATAPPFRGRIAGDSARSFARKGNLGESIGLIDHYHRARQAGRHPCIWGRRVTVYAILTNLAAGMTPQPIPNEFPYLTMDDIHACPN